MPVVSWRASSEDAPAALPMRGAFPGDELDLVSMATCQPRSRLAFSKAATRACCNSQAMTLLEIRGSNLGLWQQLA